MEFSINRGIGNPAEFKGLKSQYLFIFAGGLLGLFVVVVVMFMAGVNHLVCIILGIAAALGLVYGVFHLNDKYGEHGLMKAQAKRSHPRYVINRRNIPLLFKLKVELSEAIS
jgi:hypothetical protein